MYIVIYKRAAWHDSFLTNHCFDKGASHTLERTHKELSPNLPPIPPSLLKHLPLKPVPHAGERLQISPSKFSRGYLQSIGQNSFSIYRPAYRLGGCNLKSKAACRPTLYRIVASQNAMHFSQHEKSVERSLECRHMDL